MVSLVIDGSNTFLDLSIFNKKELLYCSFLKGGRTFSEILIKLIDNALYYTNNTLEDIESIYCVAGPGRHTSLRVVISTLKGLFFSKKVKAYKLNAMDLTAAAFGGPKFRVVSETFSSYAYFCDYTYDSKKLKRLNYSIERVKEEEIYKTNLPIVKTNDERLTPKTKHIFTIEDYAEKVDLINLNPIY
ncbi:peptidase M22 [Hippea maritima]|uniref:Peptidase M22 glycoprotease n=1 Tax=Hippea maritima (strain ATCC 700847 / DSM 10411 / MH2) TaxID=760142 RepID=F2LW97_HIPMA|nr:peptidase M22 [Hippea maritima]AEA34031.1 peptidase M22 glycoprotease [Hippea maritima DSM 10411]